MLPAHLHEELTVLRRHIHQHPDASNSEFPTSTYLQSALVSKGLDPGCIVPCFPPGFYADIRGEAEEAEEQWCIAFRTELDALSIQEENWNLTYRSVNDGVAHMCGHDGHMSMVVGVCWVLLLHKSSIPRNCTVRLIFQPAEEVPPGGAQSMIAGNCLLGVDEIYAFHNVMAPAGVVLIRESHMLAQSSSIDIEVRGTGNRQDPDEIASERLATAADIVVQVHSIIQRNISCFDQAVMTICQMDALADLVRLQGTMRVYDPAVIETLKSRIRTIAEGVATAHCFSATVYFHDGYPPTVNHREQALQVLKSAKRVHPEKVVPMPDPAVAAEDFSYYLQKCPGAMAFLGNAADLMLHTEKYDFNDEIIKVGVEVFLAIIEDRFGVRFARSEGA